MKKFILTSSIVAFLGILVLPGATQAATIQELQAQITALQAQLQQLQSQLTQTLGTTAQGTNAIWCHTFNVDLKYGDKGNEISTLQIALSLEGFNISFNEREVPVFGEQTASAVSGLQQKYKSEILTPLGLQYGTGYVGAATRAKLNKLYGCGVVTPPCPLYPQPVCKEGEKIISGGLNENGCSLPGKCVSSTQPSITVLSPNGGETWGIGKTYTVSWKSTNAPANAWVALFLTNGPFIAQGLATTDSYSWKIPTEYCGGDVCGFPLQPGSNYKIDARIYTGPSICISGGLCPSTTSTLLSRDYSDAAFSIVAATTCNQENQFCGGIANIQCCAGFTCKLDGNYPDAGGKCVKETTPTVSVELSGPQYLTKGVPLVINWKTAMKACRAWFEGTNETAHNLPGPSSLLAESYPFPTNNVNVISLTGNRFTYAIRCFDEATMNRYSNDTRNIPSDTTEGVRVEKTILVLPVNCSRCSNIYKYAYANNFPVSGLTCDANAAPLAGWQENYTVDCACTFGKDTTRFPEFAKQCSASPPLTVGCDRCSNIKRGTYVKWIAPYGQCENGQWYNNGRVETPDSKCLCSRCSTLNPATWVEWAPYYNVCETPNAYNQDRQEYPNDARCLGAQTTTTSAIIPQTEMARTLDSLKGALEQLGEWLQ